MPEYWYCLKHHQVEREGDHLCRAIDRMGPYETAADAERALEKAQQRNEAWDNDPDWNDDAGRED